MACDRVKLSNGTVAILCGRKIRIQYCACGHVSELLCDWKVKGKKSGTCDRPICRKHALEVGPDKHLCPEHRTAYEAWQKRRAAAGLAPEPADPQQTALFGESDALS